MDASTYLGNAILNAIRGGAAGTTLTAPTNVYLSAHTADPGLTGANELSGASYARTSIEFNAASAKVLTNANQESLTMPSSGGPFNIPFLGIWDAASAGNFLVRVPLLGTAKECTATASTDLITTGEVHSFLADDRVIFDNVGGILPTGLTAGVVYFILASGLTTTAFKVATTSGGTAIDITADGGAIVRKVALQAFNNANILQVSAGALTLAL